MTRTTRRPRIGLTPDIDALSAPETNYVLRRNYADAILAAGGLPFILPYCDDVAACLDALDAVVITGGMFDIDPAVYRGKPMPGVVTKPVRTAFEKALIDATLARDMPILGICNGLQLLAVALGGQLVQHIPGEIAQPLEHKPAAPASQPHHTVDIRPGSRLGRLTGGGRHRVNSMHHQSVLPSSRYDAVAHAPDGVVEAIEVPDRCFCLGLQWHPEYHTSDVDCSIWTGFCAEAAAFRRSDGDRPDAP